MQLRFIFSLFSCCLWLTNCFSQTPEQEVFNEELGPTKVEALKSLIRSYEKFLYINYPNQSTLRERWEQLLNDMLGTGGNWKFNDSDARVVLDQMEKSGLRRDIYIYRSERETYTEYPIEKFLPQDDPHDSTEIDLGEIDDNFEEVYYVELTEKEQRAREQIERKQEEIQAIIARSPDFNSKGLFLYALAKALQNDPFIKDIEAIYLAGDISPSIMAGGYLNSISEEYLNTWYYQLPFIIQQYYHGLLSEYVVNPDGF